ncbi:hypothetical protein Zmor_021793 [Zophobas morio]|uniref:Uncharacterized protein n=1 Tax=Zophobas morio TaxID=2755281 RepID=A0AA38I657_9CUCU|nr:hypothetical protein Zmor_021793 [Zophobas morio]
MDLPNLKIEVPMDIWHCFRLLGRLPRQFLEWFRYGLIQFMVVLEVKRCISRVTLGVLSASLTLSSGGGTKETRRFFLLIDALTLINVTCV